MTITVKLNASLRYNESLHGRIRFEEDKGNEMHEDVEELLEYVECVMVEGK